MLKKITANWLGGFPRSGSQPKPAELKNYSGQSIALAPHNLGAKICRASSAFKPYAS